MSWAGRPAGGCLVAQAERAASETTPSAVLSRTYIVVEGIPFYYTLAGYTEISEFSQAP